MRDENKVIWLSQTTLSVDETMETVPRLRERFPTLQDPPSDDICYATQNRQVAVKAMAPECELVIVVGSRNSSNSVRLVEAALGAGSRPPTWSTTPTISTRPGSTGVTTVGVTSGASVPEILVRGVLERLAATATTWCSPSPPRTRRWCSRCPRSSARRGPSLSLEGT